MRRKIGVLFAVVALVAVASGCSLREVQLWFAINKKQNISREQAKNIADLVNSKRAPGGCDRNYRGDCVPDNATWAHCASDPGFGPAVRGPLTIIGWDSFELDPDGDKRACDSPVGGVDYLGQEIDGIAIRGWGFDPDTIERRSRLVAGAPPDKVLIVENGGAGFSTDIDEPRPDVAGVFPGIGANHGFDLVRDADIGETAQTCVYVVNTGGGSTKQLKCKTITVQNGGEVLVQQGQPSESTIFGLIEAADRVPGGVHVRGFVVNDHGFSGIAQTAIRGAAGPAQTYQSYTHRTVRDDVNSAFGLPGGSESGFDLVIPDGRLAGSGSICLVPSLNAGSSASTVMCRAIDS